MSLAEGDILILPDAQGRWLGAYEYVRRDAHDAGRLIVRDRSSGELYTVAADQVRRPIAGCRSDATAGPAGNAAAADGSLSGTLMTDAQRRLLFALARRVGMSTDELRSATPEGSISKLTRGQAALMIDRLGGGDGRQPSSRGRGQGTVTGRQLGMIAHLQGLIGFTSEEFSAWLSKRFGVAGVSEVRDIALASRIIGGLLRMQKTKSTPATGGGGQGLPPAGQGGSDRVANTV